MVRILANGDIVPDDDPRAQQTRSRGFQEGSQRSPGGFQSASNFDQGYQQPMQQVSVFDALNQKLIALGIPPFNIGDIRIEPIVTVGLLLALILFGLPGLLIGGLLFMVNRWSQNGAPPIVSNFLGGGTDQGNSGQGPNHRPRGQGWGGAGGGGHRLGYD